MARSIAGMVLAQIRNSAKMSQLQLAQAMGISAQMVSFLETGQRSLSKTKTRTVERALWGTRADRERCDTLHAAIRADEICDILLDECDETIDMIFSEPLTREVGHNLVLALSTNDIFTREEKNKILDRLKESIEHSFRINDIRAVNVRNQGYYYLSRGGGVGIKEYLGEVYKREKDDVCVRSIAIGRALLGDTKFLRTNYVGKLIDDEDEERRNIGYIGYWSGERYSIVKPEEAYSDSGEWRRERTLYTLLERKGQNILEDNPRLSRILAQTPHNVVDSDIDDDTAKYESRKIKGAIDDALKYYRKAKL